MLPISLNLYIWSTNQPHVSLINEINICKIYQEDDWYVMKQDVTTSQGVWMFPKQTPWKHKFDETIRQLSWFGLIDQWHKVRLEGRYLIVQKNSNYY